MEGDESFSGGTRPFEEKFSAKMSRKWLIERWKKEGNAISENVFLESRDF